MIDDFEHCYAAVSSRDARFDGWFVTAVTSTHIYCRPSCPALTPRRQNVRFYATAAAAQEAGFRACKRCRPDASPGSPEWDYRADVVGRAMRLIGDGVVDRDGVAGLAARLGYSARHIQRLLVAELGAGPIALARAQRAQTARILVETTTLDLATVAFAAGFSSVRQFNDTVRAIFATTPSELRRRAASRAVPHGEGLLLRLPYRAPFDADGVLGFLSSRAVGGVESGDAGGYRRSLALPHGAGVVAFEPADGYVRCRLRLDDVRDLHAAVQRCRRLLDLDADPVAVDAHLGADPVLAAAVATVPGRRVPGAVDGDEIAIRAVLGQQVSVAGARTLAGRLVAAFGKPLTTPDGDLTHLFPTADALAEADLSAIGMPASRQRTVRAVAAALAGDHVSLDPGADRDAAAAALLAIPGVGPWTAAYVALRALHDPDAFPASDLGVRRAFERLGLPADPRSVTQHAERWRPWRGYALMHLWHMEAA